MTALSERYRVLSTAGGGQAAGVAVAQHRVRGEICVLKHAPAGTELADAVHAEGRRLADLAHPNLVRYVESLSGLDGADGQRVAGFAMGWVDGEPVDRALGPRPVEERIALFDGLLQAVDYLHRRELLHLDLKPANALLARDRVVLLDLGTARPADGGPGDVGGTLGYAAPEVLAGQAASVASDVYSLGTMLYEILCAARPFGDAQGRALRQAVLAEEPVPLRAVAPGVSRELAALVEAMLARQAAERPRTVAEVRGRLADLGFAIGPAVPGAPPLLGREREAEALREALEDGGPGVLAVLGEPGSGRGRLVRHVLERLQVEEGRRVCDLSGTEVLLSVHRLLARDDPDMPPPGPGWADGVRQRLRRQAHWQGVVYLGDADHLSPGDRTALAAVQGALAGSGMRVVWTARTCPGGATPFPLSALDASLLERIGRFAGAPPGPSLRLLVTASGGLPGAVLDAVAEGGEGRAELEPPLREVLEALETLPFQIPPQVVEALPAEVREGVAQLRRRGLVRPDPAGALLVPRPARDVPLAPAVRPAVEAALASEVELDPLWRALALVRLDRLEEAAGLLEGAVSACGERTAELVEVCRRLSEAGDDEATRQFARMAFSASDGEAALAALGRLREPDAADAWLEVHLLRRQHDLERALEVGARLAERHGSGRIWLEVVTANLTADRLEEGEQALERARAAKADFAPEELLKAEVQVAIHLLRRGRPPPDLDRLLRRVEEAERSVDLPASTLSACGRILREQGESERARRLLGRAVRRADEEGDLALGAAVRTSLGNLALQLQRSGEGRRWYGEALQIRRALGDRIGVLMLLFNLTELELRLGNLPPAERYLAEFQEVATQVDVAGAADRGALLVAWVADMRGRHEEALAALEPLDPAKMEPAVATARAMYLARAWLALGRPERGLAAIDGAPPAAAVSARRKVELIRGRLHLAIARRHLGDARETLPPELDPLDRLEAGETLLAHAGEDLDPETFGARREELDVAARLLTGPDASRAATLRDRLLPEPGARLETIVGLTDAMHDPRRFPEALARLVQDALGAHRVLIMVRMPGLGQQVTFRELSGQEAAGISDEVLRRVQKPDDVWKAADAFADPRLREASATVRTFKIRSLLAVAIPHEGQAIGALYVDDLHRADRFTEEDVAIMRRFAAAIARMVPLLAFDRRRRHLLEAREILGVILQDADHIQQLEDALDLLTGEEQTNLLVTGPTGAGKSWLAHRVAHEVLGLDGLVEVVLRRGDLNMLVGQLAGTRKGEFTGSIEQRGAIRRAITEKKALFLDEIQTLDDRGQQILLPLLELPHRRFGGLIDSASRIEGHLHVILGTNVEVAGERWRGHFREDLWWRMSRVHVHLPPLAERGPEAVYRYFARLLDAAGLPRPELVLDVTALQRFTSYDWPGNFRELESCTGQIVQQYRRHRVALTLDAVRRCNRCHFAQAPDLPDEASSLDEAADDKARAVVLHALEQSDWNQSEAARRLDTTPSRVHRMLKRWGLLDQVKRERKVFLQSRDQRREAEEE